MDFFVVDNKFVTKIYASRFRVHQTEIMSVVSLLKITASENSIFTNIFSFDFFFTLKGFKYFTFKLVL